MMLPVVGLVVVNTVITLILVNFFNKVDFNHKLPYTFHCRLCLGIFVHAAGVYLWRYVGGWVVFVPPMVLDAIVGGVVISFVVHYALLGAQLASVGE